MTGRSRGALAAGLAAVALYGASAWLSGSLSPLARRPLLDGLLPPSPYRWVDPPPELADTNVEPAADAVDVDLGTRGSLTSVFTTDDAQVTLILPRGSFAPADGARAVEVTVEPLAASAVERPRPPDRILGNVYLVEATYRPSGDRADLAADARVVLVYPTSAGPHGGRAIVVSTDGERWTEVDTNDLPSIQQADGPIDALGYVAVARTAASPSGQGAHEGGGSSVQTVAIAAGLVVLAVVAGLMLRQPSSRRTDRGAPSRPAAGGGRGSRPSRSRNSRRD